MHLLNPLRHPVCLDAPRRCRPSTWLPLVPFGMLLVDLARPRRLVELGTYNGVSYCGFCQAVVSLDLDTRCFAVDSWRGDPHGGYFGAEVLEELRAHHDPLYARFSSLIQGTFDEARGQFDDLSIDMLHIDGLHTYEAVKHDFDSWLPKLTDRGIVLFHDIAIRDADFGVWRLWERVRGQYPSFELGHGCGLGVLGVGSDLPEGVRALTLLDSVGRLAVQRFFHVLGTAVELGLHNRQLRERMEGVRAASNARKRAARAVWPWEPVRRLLARYRGRG